MQRYDRCPKPSTVGGGAIGRLMSRTSSERQELRHSCHMDDQLKTVASYLATAERMATGRSAVTWAGLLVRAPAVSAALAGDWQAMTRRSAQRGAVATQVRVGDPWFLFPAVMGALAWAGLWCRSPRLRELLPLVS